MNDARNAAAAKSGAARVRQAALQIRTWVRGAALNRSAVALAGAGAVLVAIFARVMNYDVRRDENLYAAPALLLRDYDLYDDFFYNHVPYSAWLFRTVKVVLGGDHVLFGSRLALFGAWALLAAAVIWISWRLTRSRAMTAFLFLSVMANRAFLTAGGMAATNNFLPLPFVYIGLGLFIIGLGEQRLKPLLFFLSGASLGLAAGLKINAAAFIPPVAAAAFLAPAWAPLRMRIRRVAAPLAAGGLVSLAPVLVYLLRAPEQFIANVLLWHIGPHAAYWATQPPQGLEAAQTFAEKAALAFIVWTDSAGVLILTALFMLGVIIAMRRAGASSPLAGWKGVLDACVATLGAAVILAAAVSFLPTPSFPQYFNPPLICAPLILAVLFSKLTDEERAKCLPALIAASIVLLFASAPRLGKDLPQLARPSSWTVMTVHEKGREIAAILEREGAEGPVATFAPIYALEGDLPVYREIATGRFAYRAAPFTPPEIARYIVASSPAEIGALLEREPPAAILVGVAPDLERPLAEFAERRKYKLVEGFSIKDRDGELVLYVRAGD